MSAFKNNNYFILRHGEARSNKEKFVSSWPEKRKNPLTEKGRKQVKQIITKIKKENVDLIFSSDLLRTKQTAEIVAKELGLKINFDKRLREHDTGELNGKSMEEWYKYRVIDSFNKKAPNGESFSDIKKRVDDFLSDIEKKYKDKDILIIAHGNVLIVFQAAIKNLSGQEMLDDKKALELKNAELRKS